jgi:hypothetical protein
MRLIKDIKAFIPNDNPEGARHSAKPVYPRYQSSSEHTISNQAIDIAHIIVLRANSNAV